MNPMKAPEQPIRLPDLDVEEVDRLMDEGRTLPPQFYTDPAMAALEDRVIFRTAWQMACSEIEVAKPGDFVTLTICSVPLVVIRDGEDRIHAFVNVCRHRAGVVVEGAQGSCKRMQCQYHGWTYALDGSLQGAPGFAEGLPPFETLGLHSVSVECWAGLVFVSLEPTQTLQEQLGELPRVMEESGYDFPFANGGVEFAGDYHLDMACNWKLYHENNHECYHCATTHKDSFSKILKTRETEGLALERGSRLRIPLNDELLAMCDSEEARNKDGYAQFILWPNAYVITGHVGELLFRIDPRGHNRAEVTGRVYQRPGSQPAELTKILDDANRLTVAEDQAMVEGAQIGLESGYFDNGPTLPGREVMLRAFYREVWDALRPAFA